VGLPATEVVGQLPHEFLLSVAFKVLGWTLLVGLGFAAGALVVQALPPVKNRRQDMSPPTTVTAWLKKWWKLLALAAVTCLALGVFFESIRPLPRGVACQQKRGSAPIYGWYIGQSGDHTYIGEIPAHPENPSRIASLPNDKIGFVFIGGAAPDDRGVELCSQFASSG
jgi:hypothetical protein